ncbi:MAG: hypothetical protein IPK13_07225 [Deltaproteobacteria bacterium]|nr:hypothetical protein [Deltaproteobacteria bacterium]
MQMLQERPPPGSKASDRWLTAFVLLALSSLIVSRFAVHFRRFTEDLIGNHGDVLAQHLICAWQWQAVFEGRAADVLSLPSYAPFDTGLAFSEPLTGIVLLFAPVAGFFGSVAAYNTALIGSFVFTALAVYALVKEIFESEAAGVFAAVAIPFVAWRTFHFTTLNILTIYFGLIGLTMLVAWVRRARWRTIIGAALLYHIQFLTVPQVGLVLVYTTLIWLAVYWVSHGRRWSKPRVFQIAVAALIFLGLGLPWRAFFGVAQRASRGLLRTHEMEYYALDLNGLAERTGTSSWLGVTGGLGLLVIVLALVHLAYSRSDLHKRHERHPLSRDLDRLTTPLGLSLGGALLFVLGLGAYRQVGDGTYVTLPGLFAFRHLPLLDALRVPSRLAALTPVWLAMLSSALVFWIERAASGIWPRWGRRGCIVLPLALAATWPSLPIDRMAPIDGRPSDLQVGDALSKLPEDAVILPIPIELHHSRASHVEEWVLKHKRRQIAGDKARVPNLFFDAQRRLGGWPRQGNEVVHAFAATHIVAPLAWFRNPTASSASASSTSASSTRVSSTAVSSTTLGGVGPMDYRLKARVGSFGLFEVLDTSNTTSQPPAHVQARIEAPRRVAAGQRMTLARWRSGPVRVEKRGFRRGRATWRGLGESEVELAVSTFHFLPSFWGTEQPERINVPTPDEPGTYALTIQEEAIVESERETGNDETDVYANSVIVEVFPEATTFTTPIRAGSLEVTERPRIVRANQHFRVDVRVRPAKEEPIWLATSVADAPDSRGAVRIAYAFRQSHEVQDRVARPANGYHALNRDLLPTETATVTWYLEGPSHPGHYTLWARAEATGVAGNEMLWVPLVEDLVAE